MHARELDALARYRLPEGVSELAPNRHPFSGYSARALAKAAADVLRMPERRGNFPRAVRSVFGIDDNVYRGRWTILEAHLNAVKIKDRDREFLLELGFEEDGLHVAMPTHFSGHFTLKYKFGYQDSVRKRQCYHLLIAACDRLTKYLGKEAPTLEYNLEVEVYNSRHRCSWLNQNARPWPNDLVTSEVIRDLGRITVLPQDSARTKRADIHAKLARDLDENVAVSIASALGSVGFYPVVTWSGNTVMTGQFMSVVAARRIFLMIASVIDKYCGIVELTLEPTPYFFRSTIVLDGKPRLAAIPPLISIDAR